MELTTPLALALVAAVPLALWLAQRAGGRSVVHPLWFLVEDGAAARTRRGRLRGARLLLVGAIAACAIAAAGPVLVARDGARVLVVDVSATRARDVDAVRARLAAYDEVVIAAPGQPPRRLPARDAAAAIAPTRGTVDAGELVTAIAAALPGARAIDVAAAPPIGDAVAIVHAAFHRDPLAPRRGRIVVAAVVHGAAPAPAAITATTPRGTLGRAPLTPVGDEWIAILPYDGDGDEVITVALDQRDALVATITVPPLAPAAVWIDPALAGAPIARALRVLPTVVQLDAPSDEAIAIVASSAWRGPARARIVVTTSATATTDAASLSPVPGAPVPGATAALLAAVPAVPIDPTAAASIDPAQVWLRAGARAALGVERDAWIPTVRLAAPLDGPVLPVVLADVLATAPLARAPDADVPDVRAPAEAPPVTAPPARRSAVPIRALLGLAALLIVAEIVVARPRRAALAARVAALALIAGAAWYAAPAPARRVVFVLDVSDSVAPAEAAAREALARRAAALEPRDRAAVVIVAGGARVVVPPGDPARVIAWARRGPVDPAALGLDPSTTDLAAGVALAGVTLGGPGGEIVLIGDGHDARTGVAAIAAAPARLGRHLALEPIDTGDLARIVIPATSRRATPGRAFALAVVIEARAAATGTVEVSHRGRAVGRAEIELAAGDNQVSVPVVLDAPGLAELDVALAVPGDPIAATDRARAVVDVAAADEPRTLRVDASTASAIVPAALEALDVVILDDVAGAALPPDAVATLDAFVAGGGTLVWAAGPAVLAGGAGAVEALLPVRARDREALAVLLVVDRSGSIEAAGRGAAVPDAAALAAAAAALGPDDWFGAIAFDVAPRAWIELAPRRDALAVPVLAPARGGTDPAAALRDASRRLAAAPAATRRVAVLVSDGGFAATADAAVAEARALAATGARLEVIVAGAPDEAGRARLAAVASAAGGRLHDTASLAAALPAIRAARESIASPTQMARARPAYADLLGPAPAALSAGVEVTGHVELEPAADAIVLADVGDAPLLAIRGHGAGRVVAWTTDLHGTWIDAQLSAGVIATAIAPRDRPVLELSALRSDRRRGSLGVAGDLAALGIVRIPDGPESGLVLRPAAPGQLIGELDLPREAFSIAALGSVVRVLSPDEEHASIGVEHGLPIGGEPSLTRSVWAHLPLVAALAIGVLLMVIARSLHLDSRPPSG